MAVLVVLAVFAGSAGLVVVTTLAVMFYQGRVALPGTAERAALRAQADARAQMARVEAEKAWALQQQIVAREHARALGTGDDTADV